MMDIGDPLRKDLIHAVCKRCFSDDREVSGGALHTAWVRHCIGSSHLSFFATNRAAEKQEGKALATWAAVLRNATGTTRVLVLVLCLGSFVFFCDLFFPNCMIVCLSFLWVFPFGSTKQKCGILADLLNVAKSGLSRTLA